mmetsp:Transcript_27347/g.64058  ORF Transcript_27347/g.64058 Transcript_27347/m.64058 type:complete len:283 (+) Transcript_27347:512-1360(+)
MLPELGHRGPDSFLGVSVGGRIGRGCIEYDAEPGPGATARQALPGLVFPHHVLHPGEGHRVGPRRRRRPARHPPGLRALLPPRSRRHRPAQRDADAALAAVAAGCGGPGPVSPDAPFHHRRRRRAGSAKEAQRDQSAAPELAPARCRVADFAGSGPAVRPDRGAAVPVADFEAPPGRQSQCREGRRGVLHPHRPAELRAGECGRGGGQVRQHQDLLSRGLRGGCDVPEAVAAAEQWRQRVVSDERILRSPTDVLPHLRRTGHCSAPRQIGRCRPEHQDQSDR